VQEEMKIDPDKFRKRRALLIEFMELNNITTAQAIPLMVDLMFTIFDDSQASIEMVDGYFDEIKGVYRKMKKRKEPPELHGSSKVST